MADNSLSTPGIIANGSKANVETIIQQDLWKKILKYGT